MKSMTYGAAVPAGEARELKPAFASIPVQGPLESAETKWLSSLSRNDFRTNGHSFSHSPFRNVTRGLITSPLDNIISIFNNLHTIKREQKCPFASSSGSRIAQ
jgi:hypothetical protein